MADDKNRKVNNPPAGGGSGVRPAPGSGSGIRPAPGSGVRPVQVSSGTESGIRPVPASGGTGLRQSPYPQTGSGIRPSPVARDPRATFSVPVRYRYESFIEFVESQSVNISRSGMFLACAQPLPAGTLLDLEFSLKDGFSLLKGKAEVVRVSDQPAGIGVRFRELDEPSRKLIERIVQVNAHEGRKPTVSLDFADESARPEARATAEAATGMSGAVELGNRELRIRINPSTVGYFTNNPLLNIRLGGFVVPASDEVALGVIFDVNIEDLQGKLLWSGKGKVVAKHDMRIGIRLVDADKDALARLQADIGRYVSTPPR